MPLPCCSHGQMGCPNNLRGDSLEMRGGGIQHRPTTILSSRTDVSRSFASSTATGRLPTGHAAAAAALVKERMNRRNIWFATLVVISMPLVVILARGVSLVAAQEIGQGCGKQQAQWYWSATRTYTRQDGEVFTCPLECYYDGAGRKTFPDPFAMWHDASNGNPSCTGNR